jgi:hypothetical protein
MPMVCWQFFMKKWGAKGNPKQANKAEQRQQRFPSANSIHSLFPSVNREQRDWSFERGRRRVLRKAATPDRAAGDSRPWGRHRATWSTIGCDRIQQPNSRVKLDVRDRGQVRNRTACHRPRQQKLTGTHFPVRDLDIADAIRSTSRVSSDDALGGGSVLLSRRHSNSSRA